METLATVHRDGKAAAQDLRDRACAMELSLLSALKAYPVPRVAAQAFGLSPEMFVDPQLARIARWLLSGRPDPQAERAWSALVPSPEPLDLRPILDDLYQARLAYEVERALSAALPGRDVEGEILSILQRIRKIFSRASATSGVEAMRAMGAVERVRYLFFGLDSCPVPDGRFALIVAPTNTFKTASAVSESLRMAEEGKRVLLVSAEDSRGSIMMRIAVALEEHVSLPEIRRMQMDGTIRDFAESIAERHREVLERIDVIGGDEKLSLSVIRRALAAQAYDLLVIDNVYRLADTGRSIAEAHIALVNQIDLLIKEAGIPCLLTNQMQAAAAREMWGMIRAGRVPDPAPQSVMGGAVYINDAVVGAYLLRAFSSREPPSPPETMAFFNLSPQEAWRAFWLDVVKTKDGPGGFHRAAFLRGRILVHPHRVEMP